MATRLLPSAITGLDNLELGPGRPAAERGRLASKAWAALWPKLLAIALVLAVWELVHLTGWKSYVLKGPGTVLARLWQQMQHVALWQVIEVTVARIPPLRAAVGSIITGLQTMPSIAWVPFAIIIFGENSSAILFVVVLGAAPSIANG